MGARLAAATQGDEAAAGLVVACSALRRAYRDRLRQACPGLCVVFLDGDERLLAARLANRRGHYMSPSLLPSQLQTLERPGADEPHVIALEVSRPLADVVAAAARPLADLAGGARPAPLRPGERP